MKIHAVKEHQAVCSIPDDGAGTMEKLVFDYEIDNIDSEKGKGYANGTLSIDGKKHEGYFEYSDEAGPGWSFNRDADEILNIFNEGDFEEFVEFVGKICGDIVRECKLGEDEALDH